MKIKNNIVNLNPNNQKYKFNSLFNSKVFNKINIEHTNPILSNHSGHKSNIIHHDINKNRNPHKKISHQDFHSGIKKDLYYNKTLQNSYFKSNDDYYNKKTNFNRNGKSSSIEKDLDIMKIQMSCDLITYKINQIKNKVEDLHESSKKDDKFLLKKNKKINNNNTQQKQKINNFNYKIKAVTKENSRINMEKFYKQRKKLINGVSNKDNFYYYNLTNKNSTTKLDDSNICNNTFNNSYMNMNSENRINNFRLPQNDKNQYLTLKHRKKYNPNKNVFKHILLNSPNNQITSVSINNSKLNFNKKSNLSQNDNSHNNKINDLNLVKERIIQCYSHKNNNEVIAPNNNQNNFIYFENGKEIKRHIKKKGQTNSNSLNEIKYGSFDKYFFDNNNNNNNNKVSNSFNNNNNVNKFLYNNNTYNNKKKPFQKDKFGQIQEINKMLNKNKNQFNYKNINNSYFSDNKNDYKKGILMNNNNRSKLNLSVENNNHNYFNLKQYIKDEIYNDNNSISSNINKDDGIKNFNYYLNKEGDIFQNNYINNNFNLKNNNKKEMNYRNNQLNQIKHFKNPIQILTRKRNNTSINNNININSQLDTNNKNKNTDNTNNKKYRNIINTIPKFAIKKNKYNIIKNKNASEMENDMNFKKKEQLKMNNDYSKDDLLRLSLFSKEDNNINNNKNNEKEMIFDMILQEELKEKLSPPKKTINKNTILYNTIINSFSARNKKINKQYFNDIIKTSNTINTEIINDDNKKISINNNNNKIKNINKKKIMKNKPKKNIPFNNKEICHKIIHNPQQLHMIKLNDLMFKKYNYNIKKNSNINNRNNTDLISQK